MSYKNIEINTTQKPDASNNITLSINNVSDIDISTNSPSSNEVLKYDGNNWVPDSVGENFEASAHGLASSNKNTGSVSSVYDATNYNSLQTDSRNSGYGVEETSGSVDVITYVHQSGQTFSGGQGKRYTGFELPANGKFLLICVHVGTFSNSSGSTTIQWQDENDNVLGPQVVIEPNGRGSKKLYGYIETGGSAVKVFATCISTNLHKRMNKADGDSRQAIRIG